MATIVPIDAPVVESSVDTIAELRTLPGGAFEHVMVNGYYSAGDGGGGIFRWNGTDATTDNGGTIITPTGSVSAGRWNRMYDQASALNVRWFGVRGDTTTDEVAALTTGTPAFVNHTLFWQAGTYRFGSNFSFASSISHLFEKGATLAPDSGKTVTIAGSVWAPGTYIGGAGSVSLTLTGPGLQVAGAVELEDGSVANPAMRFRLQPTVGLARVINQQLSVICNGVQSIDINQFAVVARRAKGDPVNPGFTFVEDAGSGTYLDNNDILGIAA